MELIQCHGSEISIKLGLASDDGGGTNIYWRQEELSGTPSTATIYKNEHNNKMNNYEICQ